MADEGQMLRDGAKIALCMYIVYLDIFARIFLVDRTPFIKLMGLLLIHHLVTWGRDSAFGIATRYGLDGPGIKTL